jgi:glycerol-3-phosphate acyltransferase PlsY
MVSLASMLAAAAFPPLLVAVDRPHLHLVIAATAIAVLVVVRHVPNIRKIIAGQERRVGGGGE